MITRYGGDHRGEASEHWADWNPISGDAGVT